MNARNVSQVAIRLTKNKKSNQFESVEPMLYLIYGDVEGCEVVEGVHRDRGSSCEGALDLTTSGTTQ